MQPRVYKHQCVEMVGHSYPGILGTDFSRCTCEGAVERNGKWYCKRHDPVAVAAREDASAAKWQAKIDADTAAYHRRAVETKACEGVSTEVLENLNLKALIEAARLTLIAIEQMRSNPITAYELSLADKAIRSLRELGITAGLPADVLAKARDALPKVRQ